MSNSKKILITTATSEIFILRRREQQTAFRAFCQKCASEVEMLELNSAVSITGFGVLGIVRLIEAGAVHSLETVNGHLLVCSDSLKAWVHETK